MTTARLDAGVLRTLRKARELLSDRDRWTQGALAKSRHPLGSLPVSCGATDPHAYCWCLRGALHKVADREVAWRAECYLELAVPPSLDIAAFNDHRTHAEVLALLDEALHARP
jgi:hypothetical protein